MHQLEFNQSFRARTKKLAVLVINFYTGLPNKNEAIRIIGRQLMRSVTSVGANFRATCLARSQKEKFAKICIVVEEADETLYWLELLEATDLNISVPDKIKQEALEISKVMAVSRKKIKKFL